jgi:hypothetical protein
VKLINETTGVQLTIGDTVKTFRGGFGRLTAMRPPHHSGSTGSVFIERADGFEQEVYPSVIGAKFVDD